MAAKPPAVNLSPFIFRLCSNCLMNENPAARLDAVEQVNDVGILHPDAAM